MKCSCWCPVVAMIMFGCGNSPADHGGQAPSLDGDPEITGSEPGTEPGTVPDAQVPDVEAGQCASTGASGSVEARVQLSARPNASVLVTNAAGEVAYTMANDVINYDNGPLYAEGVVRLDADLHERFSYPHGRVVALDDAGNAYVAGSFTAPIELIAGEVIVPNGNIDVFVVKLSPTGEVLFARALELCGDGVVSIVVARDGRIAVSGDAMGTVILDVQGGLLLQLGFAGQLAFDSAGNLIVGGAFTGTLDLGNGHVLATAGTDDVNAFLAKVDRDGKTVFALELGDAALPVEVGGYGTVSTPRTQAIAGVAVGPDDEIAITGAYFYEMDLFGRVLTLPPSFPSGQMAGAFLARLSASGAVLGSSLVGAINANRTFGGLLMITPYTRTGIQQLPGTPIVFDAKGNLLVSLNTTGNAQYPYAYPQLVKLDATGRAVFLGGDVGPLGYGAGVAVDGCDRVLWAAYLNEPSLNDPHTFLVKLAP